MCGIIISNWFCEKCGKTIASVEMPVRGKHWCDNNHCGGKVVWIDEVMQSLESAETKEEELSSE